MAGIIFSLICSFIFRRRLIKLKNTIDERTISPADYAVYGYDLPLHYSPESLKPLIEKKFTVEVEYINYCYNIGSFMKATSKLRELYR